MTQMARRTNDRISYIPFADPKPKVTIGLSWPESTSKIQLLQGIAQPVKNVLKN